jgi:hypothetical protein
VNGCHGRAPFKPEMHVQNGWHHRVVQVGDQLALERTARMVDVPFRMAQDCRYTLTDLGQADKGCTGCRWKVEGKGNG